MKKQAQLAGIKLKKKHGQNFLRDTSVLYDMLSAVDIKKKPVFEIGCGGGFLTEEILAQDPQKMWVFEIDPEWADVVGKKFAHQDNFTMYLSNILDIDFSIFKQDAPWTLLANLPYHVTFPILKKIEQNKEYIPEGVVMVQEEVAQKIVKKGGRGFGFISLFFQYHFEWKLLKKVEPQAFYPAPKVYSRLIHFKVRQNKQIIPDESAFWDFIKLCFVHPRRTFKNNLLQTHFDPSLLDESVLKLRAQQMNFNQLLSIWNRLNKNN